MTPQDSELSAYLHTLAARLETVVAYLGDRCEIVDVFLPRRGVPASARTPRALAEQVGGQLLVCWPQARALVAPPLGEERLEGRGHTLGHALRALCARATDMLIICDPGQASDRSVVAPRLVPPPPAQAAAEQLALLAWRLRTLMGEEERKEE